MISQPVLRTSVTVDDLSVPSKPVHPSGPSRVRSQSCPPRVLRRPVDNLDNPFSAPPSSSHFDYDSVPPRDFSNAGPHSGPYLQRSPTKHSGKHSIASYTSTIPYEKQSHLTLARTGTSASPPSPPQSSTRTFHTDLSTDPLHGIGRSAASTRPSLTAIAVLIDKFRVCFSFHWFRTV